MSCSAHHLKSSRFAEVVDQRQAVLNDVHAARRVARLDLLDGEVREADRAHEPFVDELAHRAPRLVERHAAGLVGPVEEVEVEMIDAEPLEAGTARRMQPLAAEGVAVRVRLGRDHGLSREPAHRLPDHRLVGGVAVCLGGVEPVHARVERGLDRRPRGGDVGRVGSQLVSAQADRGQANPGGADRPQLHGRDST